MQTAVQIYSLSLRETKTYLIAALFVLGNIVFPQLCHLFPQGGLIMLPIYFFTLIGAYKYGWQVGVFTAIASPLINSIGFGMPAPAMVPVIMMKGTILAVVAGMVAHRTKAVSLLSLLAVVLISQLLGSAGEWALKGLDHAQQDFVLGWPGMLLQVVGGYLVIRYLLKK